MFLIRISNFLNEELWGRPTLFPWGVVMTSVDTLPRHPSQIYEAILEGLFLCIFLTRVFFKKKLIKNHDGLTFSLFLLGYSFSRIFTENFKDPESCGMGYLWLKTTYGQWITIPLLITSFWLLTSNFSKINRKKNR